MDLFEIIKSRRTIRKYTNEKVPRELILKLLEAGKWGPTAHNMQPSRFIVISDRKKIHKIADLLLREADHLLAGFNVVMRFTSDKLRETPSMILVYNNTAISKRFSRYGSPYQGIGAVYEIQSIATVVENILLYAHSLGLGMAWYGMPLFCEENINEFLGESDQLMGILSVGFPGEEPDIPPRKDISEIVKFLE